MAQAGVVPADAILVREGEGQWQVAPPTLPPGKRMLLLEGHPAREGFLHHAAADPCRHAAGTTLASAR